MAGRLFCQYSCQLQSESCNQRLGGVCIPGEFHCLRLGVNVLESIVDLVGTRYNQVRTNPSLYVLRRTSMPAILVELAYLSNLQDAEKLLNDQYLFAFSIYIGILNYLGYSYDPFPRR